MGKVRDRVGVQVRVGTVSLINMQTFKFRFALHVLSVFFLTFFVLFRFCFALVCFVFVWLCTFSFVFLCFKFTEIKYRLKLKLLEVCVFVCVLMCSTDVRRK